MEKQKASNLGPAVRRYSMEKQKASKLGPAVRRLLYIYIYIYTRSYIRMCRGFSICILIMLPAAEFAAEDLGMNAGMRLLFELAGSFRAI